MIPGNNVLKMSHSKMQIKTTVYHFTPIRVTTIIKKSTNNICPWGFACRALLPSRMPQLPHSSVFPHYLWPPVSFPAAAKEAQSFPYFHLQISLAFSVLAGSTDSPQPTAVWLPHPLGHRVFSYQVQWQLLINKLTVTLDYSLNYLTSDRWPMLSS